jgi:hypothetical protein
MRLPSIASERRRAPSETGVHSRPRPLESHHRTLQALQPAVYALRITHHLTPGEPFFDIENRAHPFASISVHPVPIPNRGSRLIIRKKSVQFPEFLLFRSLRYGKVRKGTERYGKVRKGHALRITNHAFLGSLVIPWAFGYFSSRPRNSLTRNPFLCMLQRLKRIFRRRR